MATNGVDANLALKFMQFCFFLNCAHALAAGANAAITYLQYLANLDMFAVPLDRTEMCGFNCLSTLSNFVFLGTIVLAEAYGMLSVPTLQTLAPQLFGPYLSTIAVTSGF